jgi:hypothetical protein
MTGGDSVDGTDVRHGFEIHCDLSKPNNVKLSECHLAIYNKLPGWNNQSFYPDNS